MNYLHLIECNLAIVVYIKLKFKLSIPLVNTKEQIEIG